MGRCVAFTEEKKSKKILTYKIVHIVFANSKY